MRAKTKIGAAVGVFLFTTVGSIWWHAEQSRRRAATDRADLLVQRIALESELRRAEERRANSERIRAERARALDALRTTKSSVVDSAGKKPAAPAPKPVRISDLIANDPKSVLLMLQWQRAATLVEEGPFFRAQHISPVQIQRFLENREKREEQDIDLRAVARMENGPGEEELAALQRQAEAAYEAAQAEVLGPQGYREFQEYERTEAVRNIVVLTFAGTAALEGAPLTAQQGQQLCEAAIDAAGPNGATAHDEELLNAIDWDALDARARQILTPAQYTLYKTSDGPTYFQSRWKYQLDQIVRRAQEADAAAASSPVGLKPGSG